MVPVKMLHHVHCDIRVHRCLLKIFTHCFCLISYLLSLFIFHFENPKHCHTDLKEDRAASSSTFSQAAVIFLLTTCWLLMLLTSELIVFSFSALCCFKIKTRFLLHQPTQSIAFLHRLSASSQCNKILHLGIQNIFPVEVCKYLYCCCPSSFWSFSLFSSLPALSRHHYNLKPRQKSEIECDSLNMQNTQLHILSSENQRIFFFRFTQHYS